MIFKAQFDDKFSGFVWRLFMQPTLLSLQLDEAGIKEPTSPWWQLYWPKKPATQAAHRKYVAWLWLLQLMSVPLVALGLFWFWRHAPTVGGPKLGGVLLGSGLATLVCLAPLEGYVGLALCAAGCLVLSLLGSASVSAFIYCSVLVGTLGGFLGRAVSGFAVPWGFLLSVLMWRLGPLLTNWALWQDYQAFAGCYFFMCAGFVWTNVRRIKLGMHLLGREVTLAQTFIGIFLIICILKNINESHFSQGIGLSIIVSIRLPLFAIEAIAEPTLYFWQRCRNSSTLQFAPVFLHNLNYLPIPCLRRHILDSLSKLLEASNIDIEEAEEDEDREDEDGLEEEDDFGENANLADEDERHEEDDLDREFELAAANAAHLAEERELIESTMMLYVMSPSTDGHELLMECDLLRIERLINLDRFDRILKLKAWWGDKANSVFEEKKEDPVWQILQFSLEQINAAQQTTVSKQRLIFLEKADAMLESIDRQIAGEQHQSDARKRLRDIIVKLKKLTSNHMAEARQHESDQISNPFYAGQPLAPDRGQELFRGRENTIRKVESLLADAGQSFSLALIGPRRSGKTSLLKMLSQRLADTVTVFFDLQDNPIDTPEGFFNALARQAREQALRTHQLVLPPIPVGSTFEAASEWLRSLDDLSDSRKILLCIDEFECLERAFPGDRSQLEKLMGLFRATIQHRRKVRLLVSGAAPFDDMARLWSHYFINVREVTLDLLDRATSCELLHRPRPDFPGHIIPQQVAEQVFAATGGQPFLLQVFGTELIHILNGEGRQQAAAEDVSRATDSVLANWTHYFRDTYETAPQECQAALCSLAMGEEPQLSLKGSRWLRRRCLITGEGQLRIPILGQWIREEHGLAFRSLPAQTPVSESTEGRSQVV